MGIIYEPRGKAREYSPLAANLYRGCTHGCRYCYAPACTYRDPDEFHAEGTPRPKVLEGLWADIKTVPPGSEVLLCFTCDPYQPAEDEHRITRRAIQILHHGKLQVSILTKGGRRMLRDLDVLESGDQVGTTLTFTNPADSTEWEPGASPPEERIDMLRAMKARGFQTWVSLEPVIDPAQTLELIRLTHEFTDLFKVGKLNHHPRALEIDWRRFYRDATGLLEELGCRYYVKQDLLRYAS